jgi:predicted small integral membrane protein
MNSATLQAFRWIKIISVGSLGLMSMLIFLGNTTDYNSNYQFVEHVMKMDTVFPNSRLLYRSIQQPWVYHTAYIFLIALELIIALLCIHGSRQMFIKRREPAAVFFEAKHRAVMGLGLGILLWFTGFEVIGGEWFAMWQSNTWNGLDSANRIILFKMLTLILLYLKEPEYTTTNI